MLYTIVVYENISIFMAKSYISLFDLIDFDRFDTFYKTKYAYMAATVISTDKTTYHHVSVSEDVE